jgi:hypothetical protein
MSNYFILTNDNEPNTTGDVYPQIEKHEGWCYDNWEMLSGLKFDVLPEGNFVLDYLVLHKKAKLTDFVTDATLFWGFIVSTRVKHVLCACRLPLHKFFDVNIKVGNEKEKNYFWFFPVVNTYPMIDYSASRFQISERFLPKEIIMKDAVFNGITDIKRFESNNSKMKVHGQFISFTEHVPYDIFMVGGFSFDWIITERLKILLDGQNGSGLVTKKIDWIR